MSTVLTEPKEVEFDLDLSLEELDELLSAEVVNSTPPNGP